MKKMMMMLALVAMSFAAQAQTKFHDVEFNEASGPVKKIVSSVMGREQVTNISKDGKMDREGLTNAVYDAEGYLQSATMSVRGQEVNVSFKWENGKVKSQSMDMMGQAVTTTYNYNEQGAIVSQSMNFGGQEMKMEYTNIKYDAKGNWISRTTSMMGQEMELTRTIEYYE